MNFQRTRCQRLAASPTLLLIALAIATVLSGTFAQTADAQTVHALLVIMDDDIKITESVNKNRVMMRNMLELLPHKVCDIEIWRADRWRDDGNALKPVHILDWVKQRNVGAQDTILVYYSGHGFTDYSDMHNLELRKGVSGYLLRRSDLADALKAKHCQLKMLITDACGNFMESTLMEEMVERYGDVVPSERRYVKDLFLAHEGFLNINGASPGEFGIGTKGGGGFFTTALIERSLTAESDTNGDRFLSWKEVFAKCKTETQDLFQQALPGIRSDPAIFLQMEENRQTTQVPYAYGRLPTPIRKNAGSGQTAAVQPPQRITGNDGAPMVLIPAGEFQMGSNAGDKDEQPVHPVYVDAFYMDVYEVTNTQFKAFVDANPQWRKDQIPSKYHGGNYLKHWSGNNYPSGKANHPVTHVSWYAAMAYAERAGKRLPTEAEWEYAARGGLQGQTYPGGNTIDASQANYGKNLGVTTPVGSYGANGYGLYDMAGNVWEWCVDVYKTDFYAVSPPRNPVAGGSIAPPYLTTQTGISRVLRGGSWFNVARFLRVAGRYRLTPTGTYDDFGFRCARGTVTP